MPRWFFVARSFGVDFFFSGWRNVLCVRVVTCKMIPRNVFWESMLRAWNSAKALFLRWSHRHKDSMEIKSYESSVSLGEGKGFLERIKKWFRSLMNYKECGICEDVKASYFSLYILLLGRNGGDWKFPNFQFTRSMSWLLKRLLRLCLPSASLNSVCDIRINHFQFKLRVNASKG
jgi:hypothetical protein